MKIKRYLIRHTRMAVIFPLLAGGSLCGCSNEQLEDVPDTTGSPVEVHFYSSPATRAGEGLVENAQVRIYSYRQKSGVQKPTVVKEYTVDSSQLLSPKSENSETATEMILPSGTHGFYAVSTNSSSKAVPVFSTQNAVDGRPSVENDVATVMNGVDYLHAMTEQTIAFGTETRNIPLRFKHVGTQVQLTIKFGQRACAADEQTAASFALAEVKIQQTKSTNAVMRLNGGEIRWGNTTAGEPDADSNLAGMTVVKSGSSSGTIPAMQVATYYLLPLKAASGRKMKVTVSLTNVVIGGTTYPTHTYTGMLDASGGWAANTSNQYTLTLSGTEIIFSTVSVEPWNTGTSGGEVGDLNNTTN